MPKDLEPGDPSRIGPYRLVGVLGSGGMGRVFLGRSAGGRPVAVKVIRSELAADSQFRARFRREVAAARQVNGLYTALVVDADTDGPSPWLATAYVPGPSLAGAVADHGPLPLSALLILAAGLAEGLAAIHAAGLVHRDLKPSNVLLADDGPRVIDFGISRAADATALTGTGLVVGSPGFMSPEQADGRDVGPPSDVFSLGAVLTFAGTGQGPFGSGSTAALVYRIVHAPPALDAVPARLRALVGRCLAKDPGQRPTAAAILAELGEAGTAVGWLPETIIEPPRRAPVTPAAVSPSAASTASAETLVRPVAPAALVAPPDAATPATSASAAADVSAKTPDVAAVAPPRTPAPAMPVINWEVPASSPAPSAARPATPSEPRVTAGQATPWAAGGSAAAAGAAAPTARPPIPADPPVPPRPAVPPGPPVAGRRPGNRRIGRPVWLAGAAVLVVVAVAVPVALTTLNKGGGVPTVVGVYSGGSYDLRGSIGIAVDGGDVWVTNYIGNTLTELDEGTGAWIRTVSGSAYGFDEPYAITDDGTNVWVANEGNNSVTEVNASSGNVVRKLSGTTYNFDFPDGIINDGAHIWVADNTGLNVLNSDDGRPASLTGHGTYGFDDPGGLVTDGPDIWVANSYGDTAKNGIRGSVTELNASTAAAIRVISGKSYDFNDPIGMAVDGTDVWVANYKGNSVTELNAADGALVRVVSGGVYGFSAPSDVAVDGSEVWVVNNDGNSVTELNADTGAFVRKLSGRDYKFNHPAYIAVDGTHAWVTNVGTSPQYEGSVTEFTTG